LLSASYAEAGDRDRTGDGSLEGSCVTNYTTPARSDYRFGSVAELPVAFAKLIGRGTVLRGTVARVISNS
jgi:hypothetical protein